MDIQEKIKSLPTKSGVYIMHSADGTIIYVGKAKNLKNRVTQYFRKSAKPKKVEAMVSQIADFEYIITPSEIDALALENNLIKKHQPFYNILLKDGKTFPYIKIYLKSPFPRLEVTRRVKNDGARYFGPYIAGIGVHSLVKVINESFCLRQCKLNISPNKHAKRECLNFSIGLCKAPCTGKISKEEYRQNVDKAINFLKGNETELEKVLMQKMILSAESENFENALILKSQLEMIQKLKNRAIANMPKTVNKDAIFYETDGLSSTVSVVVLRTGKILGSETNFINDASLSPGETLFNFIVQFYQDKLLPDDIIVNYEIEGTELLFKALSKKINIITNPKGANLKLLNMAKDNAKEYLEKYLTKSKLEYNNTIGALERLKEALNLPKLPKRMECYDISNISGTNKVASMVVFINGLSAKKDYRKFKIKTVVGANDFASLQETLKRRLTRLNKQDGESFKERPDLLIIDGGKGQLSAVMEILKETDNLDIPIISLAKRIEEVFVPNKSEPVLLKPASAELKLLQRIRDEAHRFAITFHRQVRSKQMVKSPLDDIPGIGPKKREKLLKALKSTDEIKNASISELNMIEGIDIALATKIYNYFNKEK